MKALPPILSVSLVAATVLSAQAGEDLLANGGFESPAIMAKTNSEVDPAEWTVFASTNRREGIGLTSNEARGGKQSVRLVAEGNPESYQGLFQAWPVTVGTTYRFRAYVRSDALNPMQGPMRGQISIEWKDPNGGEIERVWGDDWGAALSAKDWKKVEVTARPPANAVTAHFVISQFDGKDGEAKGAFLVDDAAVTPEP